MMSVLKHSFEEIRLPFFPGAQGGTSAAGRPSFAIDNASRLRAFSFGTLRLAGRFALTQLRSVVLPGRAISTTLRTNSFNVIQRFPRAVSVVAYPLHLCVDHYAASPSDPHQTPERSADVQIPFAGFANDHG